MAITLGDVLVMIKGDSSPLKDTFAQSKSDVQAWGAQMGDLAKNAVLGAVGAVAAGAAALLTTAFTSAETLDKSYDSLIIKTGATGDELKGLQEDYNAVFADFAGKPEAVSDAMGLLNTRLGLTGEGLQKLTKSVAETTELIGGDATQRTELLTRTMGDWGVANEDGAKTLDKFFVAQQTTGAGMDGLMQKVVQFGAPLRSMGFGLDESIALLGKWEKEGVNSELVMGSLRIASGKFADAGIPLRQGLDETIVKIKGAKDSSAALALGMDVFGARAGPDMVAAIREGRFELGDLKTMFDNSEGAIGKTTVATEDWGEKLEKLKHKGMLALNPLGEKLMDLASKAVDYFAPSLEKLVPFIDNVAKAIDPLLEGAKLLGEAIGFFFKGEEAAGLVSLSSGLLKIGDALGISRENMIPFIEGVQKIARIIDDFVTKQLIPFVRDHAKELKEAFIALGVILAGAVIASAILGIAGAIATLANPITLIVLAIGILATAWARDWGGIRTALTNFYENTLKPLCENIANWFEKTLPEALAALRKVYEENWNAIGEFFDGIVAGMVKLFEDIKTWFTVTLPAALESLRKWFEQKLAEIEKNWNAFWVAVKAWALNTWNGIISDAQTKAAELWAKIQAKLAELRAGWDAFWDGVWKALVTAWQTMISDAQAKAAELWAAIQAKLAELKAGWDSFWSRIGESVERAWADIKSGAKAAISSLIATVSEIISSIKDKFSAENWSSLGTRIIDGLIQGIQSKVSAAIAAIKNAVSSIVRGAEDALLSKSPSLVFAELGANAMLGMAQGINQTSGVPALAAGMAAQQMVNTTTHTINHTWNLQNSFVTPETPTSLADQIQALQMGVA